MDLVVVNRHSNTRLIPTNALTAENVRSEVLDLIRKTGGAVRNRQVEIECDEEFAQALEKITGRTFKRGEHNMFTDCPLNIAPGPYKHPPV